MNLDFENYKKLVEDQQTLLLAKLAQLGLTMNYELDVPIPEEDTPLARMFLAIKFVAENLALVNKERDDTLEVVQKQSEAILELSTPVIEIWEGILTLPLIGTIDTKRAQQIMESVLDAIVKQSATVLIMDVTGVPVVDTKVANHLIKTVDAARMLGAHVILTGVSPHNAQTLVKLGVDLSRLTTRSTLRGGLDLAFQLTENKVVKAT